MSAVPSNDLHANEPAPRGVVWIDLKTAGSRAGVDPNGLRHRLAEWLPRGLAKQEKPPGGGKPCWFVREDADRRFMRGGLSIEDKSAAFDLRPFSEQQREIILLRERVVLEWVSVIGQSRLGEWDDATAAFLDDLLSRGTEVSRATLYNWRAGYFQNGGRGGLIDKRWATAAQKQNEPLVFVDFQRELQGFYLDGNEPTMMTAYRCALAVCRRNGWPFPSYKSAQRFLNRLGKGKLTHARKGPKAFDDQCASFIIRDYTRIVIDGPDGPREEEMLSNDVWCADHHICDTIVRGPDGKFGRPWLTAWEDIRSRRIVGYRFGMMAPDSSSVLLALKHGIESTGLCIPRFCYTDNGKDFDCYQLRGISKWERQKGKIEHDLPRFAGVFQTLGIKVWNAIAYNAKAKPIEPFFGTFEDQFGRTTRTYCGSTPQTKPHHLDARLKAGEAPAFADYAAAASAWIEDVYHQRSHTGQGMDGRSPMQVHAAQLLEKRTTTPEALSCCLMLTPKPVKVRRNGVIWQGRTYGQDDPALISHFGREVQLWVDPVDVSRVEARTLAGVLIGTLECAQLVPWGVHSNEKMRRVTAKMKRHNRLVAEVEPRGMRIVRDPMEFLLEDAAAEAEQRKAGGPPEPTPPATLIPVRTGLEAASIADQNQLRQAAGSESMPFPSPVKSAASMLDRVRRNLAPRSRDSAVDPMEKVRGKNHAW